MEKVRLSKVIVLWSTVIVIFAAVIIFMLVQMSPHREDEMSADIEAAFPPEPVSVSQTVTETHSQPAESTQENLATSGDDTPMNKATDRESQNAVVQILGGEKPELASLVEKGDKFWKIIDPAKDTNMNAWQTILIQNQAKIDYTIRSGKGNKDWHLIWDGKKLKVQFASEKSDSKDILSRKKRGKYAVQIASIEEERFLTAIQVMRKLLMDGYYAYIFRTETPHRGKHWYRVRVGFFTTEEEAQLMGQEIYYRYKDEKLFPNTYWAVRPSAKELSRDIIDLRTPMNKPWMIEMPQYLVRENAIGGLTTIDSENYFVYISQRQDAETGQLTFRTRVGFFETEEQARKNLKTIEKKNPMFADAKIIQL
ncbi:MAG: SPOR domain-containing protein [SAR324 cluster bacterium]|nr:SPOR domain-containing protein [SAR324 cluster bacterium]